MVPTEIPFSNCADAMSRQGVDYVRSGKKTKVLKAKQGDRQDHRLPSKHCSDLVVLGLYPFAAHFGCHEPLQAVNDWSIAAALPRSNRVGRVGGRQAFCGL
jgi:hypothetical protein